MFDLTHIRVCKIDAEGCEIEMLRTLTPPLLATIDSVAAEIHPDAYSPSDLAKLMIGWGTHQIGFNEQTKFSEHILRAVSNRILLDTDVPFTLNRVT